MRSCEEFALLASLAVDGEASEAEQAELAAHLEVCPACRAYFADIRRIHEAFVRAEIVVPEGLAARVMDRVRETEQERPEEPTRKIIQFPHWKRWAALAACCAMAALSLWAVRWNGGMKDAMVTADEALSDSAEVQMMEEKAAAQEPALFCLDDGAAVEGEADLDEVLPMPEEYGELAKSVLQDSAGEDEYPPLTEDRPDQEAAMAAGAPPASATDGREEDRAEEAPAPEPGAALRDELISMEDARSAALAHAGLTENDVTFTKQELEWEDGRQVYDLEFYTPAAEYGSAARTEYDYEIDAATGAIVEFEAEAVHE